MNDPENAEYRKLAEDELYEAAAEQRKEQQNKQQLIRSQQWTLDPTQQQVRFVGQTIALSFVEFEIFRLLSSRPYWAFTQQQIVAAIDPAKFDITVDKVETHIESLRGKLGMFSDYIQSVHKIGYRFKP